MSKDSDKSMDTVQKITKLMQMTETEGELAKWTMNQIVYGLSEALPIGKEEIEKVVGLMVEMGIIRKYDNESSFVTYKLNPLYEKVGVFPSFEQNPEKELEDVAVQVGSGINPEKEKQMISKGELIQFLEGLIDQRFRAQLEGATEALALARENKKALGDLFDDIHEINSRLKCVEEELMMASPCDDEDADFGNISESELALISQKDIVDLIEKHMMAQTEEGKADVFTLKQLWDVVKHKERTMSYSLQSILEAMVRDKKLETFVCMGSEKSESVWRLPKTKLSLTKKKREWRRPTIDCLPLTHDVDSVCEAGMVVDSLKKEDSALCKKAKNHMLYMQKILEIMGERRTVYDNEHIDAFRIIRFVLQDKNLDEDDIQEIVYELHEKGYIEKIDGEDNLARYRVVNPKEDDDFVDIGKEPNCFLKAVAQLTQKKGEALWTCPQIWDELCESLGLDYKQCIDELDKLAKAGLIEKRKDNNPTSQHVPSYRLALKETEEQSDVSQ